jgi:hypothetical protein
LSRTTAISPPPPMPCRTCLSQRSDKSCRRELIADLFQRAE